MNSEITYWQVTPAQGQDSEFVQKLVTVFCAAREKHLRFLMEIHHAEEDYRFFRQVMLPANQVWIAEVDHCMAGFIAFIDGWVS